MSKTTKKRLYHLEKYIQNKWGEHYWNFIMKFENILDWTWLSLNSNITMNIIEKYPDKPWNWYYMSQNPNITMEIIQKYPDKPRDWLWISLNKFTKEKELFYQKYYRIYMATFILQQYFNRMYDNPKYLFCRNRLDRLFSEMS